MTKSLTYLFLTLAISSFGQNSAEIFINFNGLYQTECEFENDDDEGTRNFLRFYSDGKVISASVDCEGTAADLKDWFNTEMEHLSIGNYECKVRKIQFSTTSKYGTVNYRGRITKNKIIKLKWTSLINKNKGRGKYKFIEITDMK